MNLSHFFLKLSKLVAITTSHENELDIMYFWFVSLFYNGYVECLFKAGKEHVNAQINKIIHCVK